MSPVLLADRVPAPDLQRVRRATVQDSALLEIEKSIGILGQYGATIGNESKAQTGILEDIDSQVQTTTAGLANEANRAEAVSTARRHTHMHSP